MDNVLPKYYIIKNDIIKKINNNELAPHQPLPSERELIDCYNVSRITVRRAIDELVKEGYVYKVSGKGSFVNKNTSKQNLNTVHSYTEEITNQGKTPSRKILNVSIEKGNNEICKKLNLCENEDIFVLERVYYADEKPLCLTKAYLPYKHFSKIECFDFGGNSLYDVLENFYDVKITRATQVLEAASSGDNISNLLDVKDGHPLLLFNTTTYGQKDGAEFPIEYFMSYYKTDNMKYVIEQSR
ncbi:MAG: GntR family transcriptional regulator [Peptostreptococcaceae bacterium]